MNFNKLIDMLFNETTINQEAIEEEIPNIAFRSYFYSIIQAFKPEEILKIFNNNNTGNSSLILLFKDNQQSILQNKSFKHFTESIIDMVNEPELQTLNYSIANYITNTNPSNYQSLYSNAFKQLIFYPNIDAIHLSLELIENITNKLFKCIDNKQFFLSELYTPEYMMSNILDNIQQEKETIAQMMVIYFVYQYHINFNLFRDKFQMLFDNPIGNAQAISNARDNFTKIAYFQEKFYCNFSLVQLYHETFVANKCKLPKLENAIVLIMSSIAQFLPRYRIYKLKPFYQGHLSRESQLDHIEEMLQGMNASNDWSNWFSLLYHNPYLIAIGTINYFATGSCKADSYNYYDINDLYEWYKSRIGCNDNNIDSANSTIAIFIKCLIVIYVFFNCDMKKYSFCLEEDQQKIQANIIQFNTNVIMLLWKIKTQITVEKYNSIKYDIYLILNDILYYKEACLINIISNNDIFDDKLIQYIIENIESSHICSKYFNDFFSSKETDKILNGFLLFGHWATKYPIKYIYTRLLDVLFIFKNTIDLRTVLINEANINKFIKGLYLLFKAFPHLNTDFVEFIKYIRNSVTNWINDYSLLNYAIQSIDKLYRFVTHDIINANYDNINTGLVNFASA